MYRKLKVPVTEIKKSEFNNDITMEMVELSASDEPTNYLKKWAKSEHNSTLTEEDNNDLVRNEIIPNTERPSQTMKNKKHKVPNEPKNFRATGTNQKQGSD
jgi:hypothetical protein